MCIYEIIVRTSTVPLNMSAAKLNSYYAIKRLQKVYKYSHNPVNGLESECNKTSRSTDRELERGGYQNVRAGRARTRSARRCQSGVRSHSEASR